MTSITEEKSAIVQLLQKRYQQDENFKQEINDVNQYYGQKIIHFAKEKEDQRYIEEHILEVVSEQFFLGYYLMSQITNDSSFSLDNGAWSLHKGFVRNAVYPLLENVMQDSEVQWQRTDTEKQFAKRIISNVHEAYDVLVQLRKDVLALGAYYAFIESPRYQEPVAAEHPCKLASPVDLTFLNPQVFMQVQEISENVEQWTLYQAQTVKGSQWAGEIQLSTKKEGGTIENHLDVRLSQMLTQNDRIDIINQMITKIPEEEHTNTRIQFYLVLEKQEYTL